MIDINEWFEELPKNCPPSDSFIPQGEKYYRLTNRALPTSEEFTSLRIEFPFKDFDGKDECIVRAISIWADKEDCSKLLKLPRHKGKNLIEITLNKSDGLLKQTFKPSHHSWWRSIGFELSNSEIVQ